ncbi:MAG: hypothetical protein ACE1Z6_13355 [Candidatus Methylomirabilales bacterium]
MSVGNFWRAVIARFIANYLMTMTGIEARFLNRIILVLIYAT